MTGYTTKPAQFRLPAWAHEFIAREAAATSATKTDVVVEALEALKAKRFDEVMGEGYKVCGDALLDEVREWDATLADGLEDEEW
jgi:molybdopterin converting factor small subunit